MKTVFLLLLFGVFAFAAPIVTQAISLGGGKTLQVERETVKINPSDPEYLKSAELGMRAEVLALLQRKIRRFYIVTGEGRVLAGEEIDLGLAGAKASIGREYYVHAAWHQGNILLLVVESSPYYYAKVFERQANGTWTRTDNKELDQTNVKRFTITGTETKSITAKSGDGSESERLRLVGNVLVLPQ